MYIVYMHVDGPVCGVVCCRFICYTSYILSFKVRIILVYSKILSKKGRGSQSDKKNVM